MSKSGAAYKAPNGLIGTLGLACCSVAVASVSMVAPSGGQTRCIPRWALTPFRDLKSEASSYGAVAAAYVAAALAKTGAYDVVPQGAIAKSVTRLRLKPSLDEVDDLKRLGEDLRSSGVVRGELLDDVVRRIYQRKQAVVALRFVVYDAQTGLPVNGALARGESTLSESNVTDESLVQQAIQNGAEEAVRTMVARSVSTATVLSVGTRDAPIDKGSRGGFTVGDRVVVVHDDVAICTAKIAWSDLDKSEIIFERMTRTRPAVGDRVESLYDPPMPSKRVARRLREAFLPLQ